MVTSLTLDIEPTTISELTAVEAPAGTPQMDPRLLRAGFLFRPVDRA